MNVSLFAPWKHPMQLTRGHILVATVLLAALVSAAGCGSASPAGDSSNGDTDSSTRGDGTLAAPAGAEAGADSASTPDQGASETASSLDSGSLVDAAVADASPEGAADGGSNVHEAGTVGAPGCTLPLTVSFAKDVQPFLASSCGNAGSGTGCHVLDATSTMTQGGYNHAYDWITGTAHSSSCPEMPTPFRFQIVIAVIDESMPPTCSRCPEMPPTTGSDLRTPLTACQTATLQSWLDEPLVTQTHRNDGISPTTPYPMPPFN
jgi:hypothetical protein